MNWSVFLGMIGGAAVVFGILKAATCGWDNLEAQIHGYAPQSVWPHRIMIAIGVLSITVVMAAH